jgi:mono/diheme cytochrome c family protein
MEDLMSSRSIRCLAALSLFAAAGVTNAADVAGGKAVAQAQCVQCHEADDWTGESAGSLESLIRDIVAGKVKHRTRLQLSDTDIANVAAYWGQSSSK